MIFQKQYSEKQMQYIKAKFEQENLSLNIQTPINNDTNLETDDEE